MKATKKKALSAFFFLHALAGLLTLPGCGTTQSYEAECFAMDTRFVTRISGEHATQSFVDTTAETITLLSEQFDCHRADSFVSLLNAQKLLEDTSGHVTALISQTCALEARFGNAVQLSCRPLTALWNICGDTPHVPTQAEIDDALADIDDHAISLNGNTISLPTEMELDFGAVAKGYALDVLAAQFRAEALGCAVVDATSSVLLYGKKADDAPFSVAITDPNGDGILGTLSVHTKNDSNAVFLATSSNAERYVMLEEQRYGHLLDLTTGYPSNSDLASVTVLTDGGLKADYLATLIFLGGTEKLEQHLQAEDYSLLAVDTHGTLYQSPTLQFEAAQ